MIYKIYPSKDTTLYEDSARKQQNTGKDEILEIGKFYDTDNTTLLGNSRALIQFDLSDISSSIVSGDITSPQYRLRLENVESREIQSDYNLYVFPIKEYWEEGLGSEADTPHNTNSSNWVNRTTDVIWNTDNATVDRPIDPATIAALENNYDFQSNVGDFELVDTINGINNDVPTLVSAGGKLIMSASEYGGGTAHLSASLVSGDEYNIRWDFDRNTLSGVEFNIIDPNGNTVGAEYITNYETTLVSTGTYTMVYTPTETGWYKLQYTFFDNNGANGSAGSIDNFYLYKTVEPTVLVLDQFSVSGSLPSTYFINNKITGYSGESAVAYVKDFELHLSSSNFSGATLNKAYSLQQYVDYTASFDLNVGNYPTEYATGEPLGIDFTILDPNGRIVDANDLTGYERYITSSQSPTISFTARQDGEYLFRWSYFASGSVGYSGSLDNFRIKSENHDTASAKYNDTQYDAHWANTIGGGTWFPTSYNVVTDYKQSFTKFTKNLDVDVTEYVNEWIDGTRTNNGFIIKKSKTDEQSSTKFGSIKFFSSDTNTIYPPVLETRWDDSIWVTGSLSALSSDDFIVYTKGLDTEYKESSKAKIRVYGRDRYPSRTFSITSNYKSVKYLPQTTYYSVVDVDTEQIIIPFDTNYTKLSCDTNGNFFKFWFNALQPERFYKFVFRVDINGTKQYFDDKFYFKVVR